MNDICNFSLTPCRSKLVNPDSLRAPALAILGQGVRRREMRFNASRERFRLTPVLLGAPGLLRQYVHVLLSNRGDPSPRPFGHFPVAPAMLGTANGAPDHRF